MVTTVYDMMQFLKKLPPTMPIACVPQVNTENDQFLYFDLTKDWQIVDIDGEHELFFSVSIIHPVKVEDIVPLNEFNRRSMD